MPNRLHKQIENNNYKQATRLLSSPQGPKLAEKCDNDGDVPLHVAIYHNSPDEFTLALIDAYNGAVAVRNKKMELPLHYATYYGASPRVIERLIRVYPQGLEERDKWGNTPMDNALKGKQLGDDAIGMVQKGTDFWMRLIKEEEIRANSASDNNCGMRVTQLEGDIAAFKATSLESEVSVSNKFDDLEQTTKRSLEWYKNKMHDWKAENDATTTLFEHKLQKYDTVFRTHISQLQNELRTIERDTNAARSDCVMNVTNLDAKVTNLQLSLQQQQRARAESNVTMSRFENVVETTTLSLERFERGLVDNALWEFTNRRCSDNHDSNTSRDALKHYEDRISQLEESLSASKEKEIFMMNEMKRLEKRVLSAERAFYQGQASCVRQQQTQGYFVLVDGLW
eukprot:CAMPEP_0172500298 /NCGR_PEP_ID=MMETSP1066-20121228/136525_1 /TAXON_ID=671091 /ORGANISM="Coscinodiscus wailesii, Strain CCMP2513" /LENGTH=396 /DNA_ID=CAMNT_0013274451 /DNA_START=74 /DNA_END=1261 /DNA_ORIENTATION=+